MREIVSIVYLNGEYVPSTEAKVSVFDRGFLLGDGVYEVIPAYSGVLFRLEEHLARLQFSLDEIRLKNPHSNTQWKTLLSVLVKKNMASDLSVYLQVTRGVAARDHAFPDGVNATVFSMANPIAPLNQANYGNGVAAMTLDDNRWSRCNIKAISLLPNVLLRQQAVDQGVVEAILVRDGQVTEGAASNVFVVIDGVLITPPKSAHLLPGITRDLIVELAVKNGLSVAEKNISLEEMQTADEIWLTSSTKEILPVTRLDDKQVGTGKPGKTWTEMTKIYAEFKKSLYF